MPAAYRTPLPALLAGAIEAAVNRLLATDEASPQRLKRLDGRLVELQLDGVDIVLYFAFSRYRVAVKLEADRDADTTISGSPPALFAMALPEDDSNWGRPGSGVRIAGDASLARDLERLVSRLEPDWEAELSVWFGEVLGFQLASGARSAIRQARQTTATVEEWTGEHLRQADGPLAQADALRAFSGGVDALRDATERLEARLRLIRERRAAAGAPAPGTDDA